MNRKQRRAAAKQHHASGPSRLQFAEEGRLHHEAGRLDQAEALYLKALAGQPDNAAALHLFAVLRLQQGHHPEAIELNKKAIAITPSLVTDLFQRGLGEHRAGRLQQAVRAYQQFLIFEPAHVGAHNNLGIALRDLGRLAEAEARYREALRLRPDYPEVHSNLGVALCKLGRPAEAEASCREALRLKDFPEAHYNLGIALRDLGRLAEAEASYREALRLRPDHPEAHSNLGYSLLLAGRFEEGWKEQEWRWKSKLMRGGLRDFSVPLWSGEAIGERVILLHAEQGLGDTLQFCRYVPLIAAGARTVLEVQGPLVGLLSGLPGIMEIVARGDRLPSFDLHCPLLSLPRAVGTTLDTIPCATSYLSANRMLAADWRVRLAGLDGLRVGLVWAGEQRLEWAELAAIDRRRSITLDTMAPLGEVSGVTFISLQKGGPAAQTASPPRGMVLHDFTADLHDFADTAALIDGLDLVISVDTAVAHLAGGLGKPVWLLNRFDTCWRWLLRRDDSPWYPTLRQFRQPKPGDWESVICAVRDALQRLAAGDRDQLRSRFVKMQRAEGGRGPSSG